MGNFKFGDLLEQTWNDESEADASKDRERHPDGEEAFEAAQSTGALGLGRGGGGHELFDLFASEWWL